MSIESSLSKLNIKDEDEPDERGEIYQYIDVFKNPYKRPITQIHIERSWRELKKNLPEDFDFLNSSPKDLEKAYFENKTEILPALDKKWLPRVILYEFEPFSGEDENSSFLVKNKLYLEGLDYLLICNYHQFWCTILFEPLAVVALRSFLLNPILPFQVGCLEGEYMEVYKAVYNKFLLVYEKLLTFEQSEIEFMPQAFGLSKIKENGLLNLPIVITLAVLYKDSDLAFVNKLVDLYFNDPSEVDFLIKEVENLVDQNMISLEMVGGHVCGFDEEAVVVPISIEKRPAVFSLDWVSSVVNYLLCLVVTSNTLFQFYKPAVEIALNHNFPYRLPYIYVNVYRELYELLDNREESLTNKDNFRMVLDQISLGRAEFVELFNTFGSYCLDEALKHMGDSAKQEHCVETYLKLLTTALEEDYFICDYNATYNVATQNEMFESCCEIDPTRTQYIVSCINKLPRHKRLQELSKLKRQTILSVFRDFTPVEREEPEAFEPQPGPSRESTAPVDSEVEEKIRSIIDMFPHLGDGFVFQCLESYNFNTADVINAILESNLPPHLSEIPFDSIRIPPEPEPEKPILAYVGKKPEQYDDALTMLNDKEEIKDIKNLVLEGVQYNYEHMYDDEYDDRFDDEVSIPVPDNPVSEDLKTFNPNRKGRSKEEESEEESSEDEGATAAPWNRNNFCEDPAVLRERREAKFRGKASTSSSGSSQPKPKADLVGKPKGQGQDKNTVLNRQKKNVNKSSRANHNRKGGAQWKRNKGMIPS